MLFETRANGGIEEQGKDSNFGGTIAKIGGKSAADPPGITGPRVRARKSARESGRGAKSGANPKWADFEQGNQR